MRPLSLKWVGSGPCLQIAQTLTTEVEWYQEGLSEAKRAVA